MRDHVAVLCAPCRDAGVFRLDANFYVLASSREHNYLGNVAADFLLELQTLSHHFGNPRELGESENFPVRDIAD